ncbi:MAG: hypothetical protein V2A74_03055 [bacterium]
MMSLRTRASILLLLIVFIAIPSISSADAEWVRAGVLPLDLRAHASLANANTLYTIGGISFGGRQSAILAAPIAADQSIKDWQTVAHIPVPISYCANSVLLHDGILYVVGGSVTAAENSKYVYSSFIFKDGSFGPWVRSEAFPTEGVTATAAVVANNFLYVIGGAINDVPQSAVFCAPIGKLGQLGHWTSAQPLPQPLWFHNAFVDQNRLYVVGGARSNNSSNISASILSASVEANGNLGPWRTEQAALPMPIYTAALARCEDRIFLVGGRTTGGGSLNDVHILKIAGKGLVYEGKVSTNLEPIKYHAVAAQPDSAVLYLSGGKLGTTGQTDNLAVLRIAAADLVVK